MECFIEIVGSGKHANYFITGFLQMYGTIFSQCLHDLDILDQLTAASLTEVLLTQFSWVERVG